MILLSVALIRKLRGSFMCLAYFVDMLYSLGVPYNQALADAQSTGVGINLVCTVGCLNIPYNPSNAEATFIQTKVLNISENHLNPVMLVFIGKLSLTTPRWGPIC